MGFTKEHLGFAFEIPVSDRQAYRQFGNSVVVPQFNWIADELLVRAGDVFAARLLGAAGQPLSDAATDHSRPAIVA